MCKQRACQTLHAAMQERGGQEEAVAHVLDECGPAPAGAAEREQLSEPAGPEWTARPQAHEHQQAFQAQRQQVSAKLTAAVLL